MYYKKNQLIVVNKSSDNPTIDARQLHEQLQVSIRFNDWIRRRIQEFGFEEGKDFYSKLSKIKSKETRGRKSINYDLSLDMAKELAMLERSETGKRVRRYFIAVEKEARKRHIAQISGNVVEVPGILINGVKMMPFRKAVLANGWRWTSSSQTYRHFRGKYAGHAINIDNVWYISKDLLQMMVNQRNAIRQRRQMEQSNVLMMGGAAL